MATNCRLDAFFRSLRHRIRLKTGLLASGEFFLGPESRAQIAVLSRGRMLEHYSHIRLDAKRKALESLPTIRYNKQTENQTSFQA